MAWASPITWTAGLLTSANLNTLRDALKAIGDPWTSYTPTWTGAGGNPAIGNGTIRAAYLQAGSLVIGHIAITMGSTTTYGSGAWALTLPAAPNASIARSTLVGLARDTSAAGEYPLYGVYSDATVGLRTLPTTAGNPLVGVTSTVPFTWATGDVLTVDFTYEAA